MSQASEHQGHRHASLKLSNGANGQVITARVPLDCSEEDFVQVSRSVYGLINKLTGCHCASGRISAVVEDVFVEAIQVNLEHTAR